MSCILLTGFEPFGGGRFSWGFAVVEAELLFTLLNLPLLLPSTLLCAVFSRSFSIQASTDTLCVWLGIAHSSAVSHAVNQLNLTLNKFQPFSREWITTTAVFCVICSVHFCLIDI